jgi:hypothetical protein
MKKRFDDVGAYDPKRNPPREKPGKGCQSTTVAMVVLAPIAIPYLVARTAWLRKTGRIK